MYTFVHFRFMHPPVQSLLITCTQLNNCLEMPLHCYCSIVVHGRQPTNLKWYFEARVLWLVKHTATTRKTDAYLLCKRAEMAAPLQLSSIWLWGVVSESASFLWLLNSSTTYQHWPDCNILVVSLVPQLQQWLPHSYLYYND